ncbi:uncharacterized protein LOC110655163 [Hevea brasiliensis]|uniref:uncharacterized protein LOC110655163 n=1 Tax=Hevea brasiliensis TaxID=3981 RepID=UPI0025D2771E|nr:uncharacterized protein LOC110655163 [Hevea brasiliensis]
MGNMLKLKEKEWLQYKQIQKLEVFGVFQKFKAMVESQSDYKIKTLRSDNGTEYTFERFNKFCEEVRIHHQLIRSKLDHKAEIGVFLGYGSNVKGYRAFNVQTEKAIISRNIKFDEFASWCWDKKEVVTASNDFADEADTGSDSDTENVVRGIRSLADIYERCNIALVEPVSYEEAAKSSNWRAAMEEKLKMIHKNET